MKEGFGGMGNLLRTGMQWLATTRRAALSSTVVYRRGALSVSLPASQAAVDVQMDAGDGTLVAVRAEDFTIAAADLVLGGVSVTPRTGDTIESQGTKYEVVRLGGPEWEWADSAQIDRVIHTRPVGTP